MYKFLERKRSLIFAAAALVCSVIAIKTGHGSLAPLFFMPLIGGV